MSGEIGASKVLEGMEYKLVETVASFLASTDIKWLVFCGVCIVLACIGLVFTLRLRRLRGHYETEVSKYVGDLKSIKVDTVAIDRRLIDFENDVNDRLNLLGVTKTKGYEPYSKATNMLEDGAKVEELISACGISRAEAELMGLMHRQMKRCGPSPWQ